MGQKDADGWGNQTIYTPQETVLSGLLPGSLKDELNVLATVMKTMVWEYPCTQLTGCYYSGLVCQTPCRCWEIQAPLCDYRPQHVCHCYGLSSACLCGIWWVARWFLGGYWLDTHGALYSWNWKFLLISSLNLLMIHLQISLQTCLPTYPLSVFPWYLHRKYIPSVTWTFPPKVIKNTSGRTVQHVSNEC